jgi:serine/threonine protein kinase
MTLKSPIVFETTFTTYIATEIEGEGGSGRIYKAKDEANDIYAIKLLDPGKATKEKVKRFKNELQFCLRNQHKNIVTVIEHGIFKNGRKSSPFYVMPFYSGSLRQLLSSRIPSNKVLPYFAQMLDGVEAAHLQRVIHRDIKPENVLYDSDTDSLLIADFGIARFEEEDLFTTIETEDATRLANFQYAAPEQRGRGHEVDHRADIYALGLILNEMFTGGVPYGTGYKTIGSVVQEYEYLDSLVSEMLRQEPSERPTSIEAIKVELMGRKNQFIEKQKISKLKQTVVTESDLDDPLILDPPRLVRFDYNRGTLSLIFNKPVNGKWVWALQNMGSHTSLLGKGPEAFSISGDKATIHAEESQIQTIVDYFKDWIPLANRKYEEKIRAERREAAESERTRIRQEIEERERRQRILKNVKL